MKGKNIYFSGPDGTKKTTLARLTAEWLEHEFGLPVKVVHFPTEGSIASSILRLDMGDPPRIKLGNGARDLLFVADRLEASVELASEREKNPQLWLIFDRGPADGAVYAEAIDRLRVEPIGVRADWAEKCDAEFLKMFPVDLGFFLTASVEASQILMANRGKVDELDRDLALQREVRTIFERYFAGKKEWKRIEFTAYPGEALESHVGEIAATINLALKERILKCGLEEKPSTLEISY